jgi:uncharacterized membrane protein required for colicin V production
MIPIEFFWITFIAMFGVIGGARGLRKELGASAILLLSLFVAFVGEQQILSRVTPALQEGIVLSFPIKELVGLGKGIFGFLGGVLNGYLVIGTLWNTTANADYFRPNLAVVSSPLSAFHDSVVSYLPVSVMGSFSPYIMLVLGMILLLAIVLK